MVHHNSVKNEPAISIPSKHRLNRRPKRRPKRRLRISKRRPKRRLRVSKRRPKRRLRRLLVCRWRSRLGTSLKYIEVAERCGIDVLALAGRSVYKMKAFTISVVHLVLPGCATSTQSLSQLRLVSKTFKETIDEYAHDLWTVVLLRCLPSRNGGVHRATAERLIRNLDQFGADRKLYDALVWNAICVNLEKDRRRLQFPPRLSAQSRKMRYAASSPPTIFCTACPDHTIQRPWNLCAPSSKITATTHSGERSTESRNAENGYPDVYDNRVHHSDRTGHHIVPAGADAIGNYQHHAPARPTPKQSRRTHHILR